MLRFTFVLMFCALHANAETTAFLNVNVVPMDRDKVLLQQTVIVENDTIVQVGPVDTVAIPKHATTVDGTDRFLLPGLVEMHAHVARAGSRSLERMLDLFVANGVTTIRGMLGHPSHLPLREQINQQQILAPRLITSGPSLNGNSVSGAMDGAAKVKRQAAAGYDFLKLHPGLTRAEFSAIAAAARRQNIPFAGHVSADVGLDAALSAQMASIDHLDGFMQALVPGEDAGPGGFFGVMLADQVDRDAIPDLVSKIKDSGVWIVPTQTLIEGLVSAEPATELARRDEMQFMPANTVASWVQSKQQLQNAEWDQAVANKAIALRRELILRLHTAGVGLLLGSDAPQVFNVPGFSTHKELQLLVDIGLTPYAAIYTATAAAGDYLNLPLGRISKGFSADLMLLDDNPLENIGNLERIHGVMLRGQWVSLQQRQDLLNKYRRKR